MSPIRLLLADDHPVVRAGLRALLESEPDLLVVDEVTTAEAAVTRAEGAKQSAILRAEAQMKVLELQAEGEKKALELRGEGEASRLTSIDTATINPHTLAVLQLKALQDIASSENAKIVVPYEATSLMGAAEVLLSTLRNENLGEAKIKCKSRHS